MDVVVREDAANGLLDEDLYLVIFFRLSDCKLSILVIRRFKSRGADEFFLSSLVAECYATQSRIYECEEMLPLCESLPVSLRRP